MEKILSIIIPTYNAEKFLDKGLTSFIMEDADLMNKLEVIVVNDGTPDNSVAVAQKYVDRYPHVFSIVSKENGGHGSAINVGVEYITGKYFKVVDADDWVDTEALKRTLIILEEEEFDAAIQSFRIYNIVTKASECCNIEGNITNKCYTLKELMERWNDLDQVMRLHGLIYNTEFYRKQNYRLIEHVYYEDQEYSTIPLCWARKIRLINDQLYIYRIGDENQSIAESNLFKRLDHFTAVIFRLIEFDAKVGQTPKGGYEYWMKKTTKFIADLYQLTLIRCQDKKKYRIFCEEVTADIQKASPSVYQEIRKKYVIFKVLNRLHVNEYIYRNQFIKVLEWTKRL